MVCLSIDKYKASVNDIPVSGQPPKVIILIIVFLEYKLTFDSTRSCMQLQISADSFVFSCVLSASCYFRT